jgi:hypothetical protein
VKPKPISAGLLVCASLLAIGSCRHARERLGDERAFWRDLAGTFESCLVTGTEAQCRGQIESREWTPISSTTVPSQEIHGAITGGGSSEPSPTLASEGDFCISHDDIDWNFNVAPDAAWASLLQPANAIADAGHPAGVIETEWEAFFLDPAYVAMPAGAGSDYKGWAPPVLDMAQGDRVAVRGAGVLDRGHSPYRSEIHPPYLLLWGGLRGDVLVVHARASALLTRPSELRTLPDPPDPSEALTDHFTLPPAIQCSSGLPSLSVVPQTEYFYDDPSIAKDQGCDLANGTSLGDLEGPAFDAALCSPAARIAGTSSIPAAASFFSLTLSTGADLAVTLAPVARPHQALYGARITAAWQCP